MRILLVEDDLNLGHATAEGLKQSFAVDWVTSAEEADDALSTTDYGLIALDINLPGISGIDFLKKLRGNKNNIPVLMLTALDSTYHKIDGLNSGADDYLVKPFDLDELIARCNALIRRSGNTQTAININGIYYEPATGIIKKDDKSISLSARERAIFDVLMRNIGRPVSKSKIEESVYDWSSENIESNTIEVHIASLRKKFGGDFIKTQRNVGYIVENNE